MKKRDALIIAAAIMSAGTLIAIGKRLAKKPKRTSAFERYDDTPLVPNGSEDAAIMSILEQSENGSVFASRYANWLLEKNGADAVADGIYLAAMRDWGVYTSNELLFESELYMALNHHTSEIIAKFGTIDTIFDLVVTHLVNAVSMYAEPYHYYQTIEEAVVWERTIPALRELLNEAVEKQNFGLYESAVTSYLITLTQFDMERYRQFKERIATLIKSEEVDWLTQDDRQLYNLLRTNSDRVEFIFNSIDTQYVK